MKRICARPSFSVGLRSITPGTAEDVEMLIMETLAELAENGIPAAAVEAAVNSVEFDLRENNSGRFPRGLAAMIRSLATWLYDGDPIAPLAWGKAPRPPSRPASLPAKRSLKAPSGAGSSTTSTAPRSS